MSTAVVDEIIEKVSILTKEERVDLVRRLTAPEPHPSFEKNGNEGKKNPNPNIEWLKVHRNEVAGQYVALENGELFAKGRLLREVDHEARLKGATKPLLTYVPREDEELWAGW